MKIGRLRSAPIFPIIAEAHGPCHSLALLSWAVGTKYHFFHPKFTFVEFGKMCSACRFPGGGRDDWQSFVLALVVAPNSCDC